MSNLKKAAITSIIVLLFLIGATIMSFAQNTGIVTEEAKLRKTASEDSIVLEIIPKKEEVEILEEQENWYKVKYNKIKGYVLKEFIKVEETAETNTVQKNENQVTDERKEEIKNLQKGEMAQVKNEAKVYIRPLINSLVITNIEKDKKVEIMSKVNNWAYINTENINGWVRIDKLSVENVNVDNTVNNQNNENTNIENNEDTTTNKDTNQTTENNNANNNQQTNYQAKTMYVKASAINVRSQSNTSSDIVTSVALNTEVKVVGEQNGWYKVEVNGKSGYIRNDLLSDKKTEVTSRDNEVDRTQQATKNEETSSVSVQTITQTQQQTQQQIEQQTQPSTQPTTNTSSSTSSNVPTSSTGVTGNDIVAYAQQFKGYRYVYGAAGPNSFDCSGFTMYVYKHFGYSLSHSSRVQATQGKKVTGELQPGDILVFTNGGTQVGHVGIYIGNDKFIHASDSTTGVIISNLSDRWNKSKYVGARRIL